MIPMQPEEFQPSATEKHSGLFPSIWISGLIVIVALIVGLSAWYY